MKPARIYQSEILSKFFNEKENPCLYEKTLRKMIIASRIGDALINNKIKKRDLAIGLNKNSSEVSKWLSGTHNFTIDTLTEIEFFLGINLLNENIKTNEPCKPCFFNLTNNNQ